MRRSAFAWVVAALCAFTLVAHAAAEDASLTTLAAEDFEENKRISMSFDGALLKDVLKILSQQSGLNFVASQDVENKKLTVYLEDVPVRDALESIINANSLRYERKKGSDIIVVYPLIQATAGGLQTRVFRLKYTKISISPLDIGGRGAILDLTREEISAVKAGAGAAGGGAAKEKSTGKEGALMAERGIDKIVASLLSEKGKVAVDTNTNSLIVTDTPESIQLIERILKEIDVPAQQVMLEAYLVEVRKSWVDDLGVDWGGTDGALGRLTGGSRTTGFPFTESIFNNSGGVKATTQGTSTLTLGTISAADFTATLRLISSQTDSKILARPRVLTLNNEAASIRLVTNTTIAQPTVTVDTGSVATTSEGGAERAETGIVLKMTPLINEQDGFVTLFLEPSITTAATSAFFSDILDPTTRSVKTTTRVRNHETLVLGGLIDYDKTTTNQKIPVLGSIPVLGKAFSYKHRADADRELLIFITPHILENYDNVKISPDERYVDLAIQRTMDHFMEERLRETLPTLSRRQRVLSRSYEEENLRTAVAVKAPLSPAIDTEMSRALDSLVPKPKEPSPK